MSSGTAALHLALVALGLAPLAAAGFLGAGLFGMLFGHGFMGGMGSFAGFLGFLIQIENVGVGGHLAFPDFFASAPTKSIARCIQSVNWPSSSTIRILIIFH